MNTAYLMGRAAFSDGKSQDDNPYKMGESRWWDWRIGYRTAEDNWLNEII